MPETRYGYVVDKQGCPIFKNSFYPIVQHIDEDGKMTDAPEGYVLKDSERLVVCDVSVPNAMLKPRWDGTKWTETATPEEVEAARPKPPPPPPADAGAMSFVVLAEMGEVDDVTITRNARLFGVWDEYWTGEVGRIAVDPDDQKVYAKIEGPYRTPQPQSQPGKDPAQWRLVGDPNAAITKWSRPIGATDAYPAGAVVTHEGKKWTNTYGDGNVWMPGAHGWDGA